MPHPAYLEVRIRLEADFLGAAFARGCGRAKQKHRTPRLGLNLSGRPSAMKTEVLTLKKKQPIAVRLEFHDDRAKTVYVAGTFNDWHPKTTPMSTTSPGQWSKELALSPGIYEYQYVVDGRWINDPQAVKSTPNPFGGRNSLLVVEPPATNPATTSNRATHAQNLRRKGGLHDR